MMASFSEAPSDPRQYVRITTDIAMNPKLAVIDSPAASWTYVCSITYSGGSFTDGHFPVAAVLRIAGTDKDVAEALVEQGLWHLPGHDCDRCPQPKAGYAYVHDYLQHQRSKEEVQDLTDKRREAGRAGAAKRWGKPRPPDEPRGKGIPNARAAAEVPLWQDDDTSIASAMASAMPNGWQTDSKAMAEERRGEEKKERGARKRGTRLPESFTVTPDMVAWAREHAPHVDGRRETEKFKNHWLAESGSRATKVDWNRTWQNWMLRAAEYAPQAQRANGSQPPSTAPDRIPREERCPEHADQRAVSCRHCAARAKAGAPR